MSDKFDDIEHVRSAAKKALWAANNIERSRSAPRGAEAFEVGVGYVVMWVDAEGQAYEEWKRVAAVSGNVVKFEDGSILNTSCPSFFGARQKRYPS